MTDKIPGGLAEGKSPDEFPPDKLKAGVEDEMEHTTDPEIAQEISMDHLAEDPNYYDKLKAMHNGIPNELYDVYLSDAHGLHPAGRLLLMDGQIQILSDYHNGLLRNTFPEGPVSRYSMMRLQNPGNNLKLIGRSDIKNGKHLDGLPEAQFGKEFQEPQQVQAQPPAPPPPSVFDYHRSGMDSPHTVEFSNGIALLDGNRLSPEETIKVLENVQNGVAKLSYRKPEGLAKSEEYVEKKAIDPNFAMRIAAIRAFVTSKGVSTQPVTESVLKRAEKHLTLQAEKHVDRYDKMRLTPEDHNSFANAHTEEANKQPSTPEGLLNASIAGAHQRRAERLEKESALMRSEGPPSAIEGPVSLLDNEKVTDDLMVPGVKNIRSFGEIKDQNSLFVVMDLNDFGHLNQAHGMDKGDRAIQAFARAVETAKQEAKIAKFTYRFGGDEFAIQADSPESASRFARSLSMTLQEIPALGGTHKISAAVGIGKSFEEASQALANAKAEKVKYQNQPVPTIVVSLL